MNETITDLRTLELAGHHGLAIESKFFFKMFLSHPVLYDELGYLIAPTPQIVYSADCSSKGVNFGSVKHVFQTLDLLDKYNARITGKKDKLSLHSLEFTQCLVAYPGSEASDSAKVSLAPWTASLLDPLPLVGRNGQLLRPIKTVVADKKQLDIFVGGKFSYLDPSKLEAHVIACADMDGQNITVYRHALLDLEKPNGDLFPNSLFPTLPLLYIYLCWFHCRKILIEVVLDECLKVFTTLEEVTVKADKRTKDLYIAQRSQFYLKYAILNLF